MDCFEQAEQALVAYKNAQNDTEKILALTQVRINTREAAALVKSDDMKLEERQKVLDDLEHKLRLYKRSRESNMLQISELEDMANSLSSDGTGKSTDRHSRVIIPLLQEYDIEATESNAEEKILSEFEARKEAQTNLVNLQREVDQLKAAEKKLKEFLEIKWPKIKNRYEEVFDITAKVGSVYDEVNDEVNRARMGEFPFAIKSTVNGGNSGNSGGRRSRKRGRGHEDNGRKRRRM